MLYPLLYEGGIHDSSLHKTVHAVKSPDAADDMLPRPICVILARFKGIGFVLQYQKMCMHRLCLSLNLQCTTSFDDSS